MEPLFAIVLLGLAVTGCAKLRHDAPPDRCLAVPPAIRLGLTGSPDGQSLYWIEEARGYNFDGEQEASWHLVRYDLHRREAVTVLENAYNPINFIGGQLLVLHEVGSTARAVLFATDGHTQELTPAELDVLDLELLDPHTFVFLADGRGRRAVYSLDLNELRPRYLLDADELLSASAGKVFARTDEEVEIFDVKSGATSHAPHIHKSQPLEQQLVYVEKDAVFTHDMITNAQRPATTTSRPWRLVHQHESVLARTAVDHDRSYASLVTSGGVTQLPVIVGGASILRTTELGNNRWALIGINTSNFIGDLADTNAETDICRLPSGSAELTFPTRQVPARFASRSDALFDALAKTAPSGTMQIADVEGDPVTVSVHLRKESGAHDLEGMRKRTREIYDLITRQLNDPEIRTEVIFADERRGIYRWRRDRLRYRTSVGMGDALVSDPADFELEIDDFENVKKDGKLTCSGKLHNLLDHGVTDIDIRCSQNRKHLVHVDRMAKDEIRPFSQTFEVSANNEYGDIELMVAGQTSALLLTDGNDVTEKQFSLGADVYDSTGLWFVSSDLDGGELTVRLAAEPDFLKRDPAAQEQAVKTAFDRYSTHRDLFGDEKAALHVRVDVERSDTLIDFDGARLERED